MDAVDEGAPVVDGLSGLVLDPGLDELSLDEELRLLNPTPRPIASPTMIKPATIPVIIQRFLLENDSGWFVSRLVLWGSSECVFPSAIAQYSID